MPSDKTTTCNVTYIINFRDHEAASGAMKRFAKLTTDLPEWKRCHMAVRLFGGQHQLVLIVWKLLSEKEVPSIPRELTEAIFPAATLADGAVTFIEAVKGLRADWM